MWHEKLELNETNGSVLYKLKLQVQCLFKVAITTEDKRDKYQTISSPHAVAAVTRTTTAVCSIIWLHVANIRNHGNAVPSVSINIPMHAVETPSVILIVHVLQQYNNTALLLCLYHT